MKKIKWEKIDKCLICECSKFKKYTKIRWHNIIMEFVLCEKCGLEFMNPRPTQEWYKEYYSKMFWEEKINCNGWMESIHKVNSKNKIIKKSTKIQKRGYKIYDRTLNVSLSKDSKVLEIGPGFGQISSLFRDKYGCEVLTVEPSDTATRFFEKKFNIQRIARYVDELAGMNKYKNYFDMIIMSHVLENTSNPYFSLIAIKDVIKDDGYLYIDSSNFFYTPAENPFHLYIFTPLTLSLLVEKSGFSIKQMFCEKHPIFVKNPTDKYIGALSKPEVVHKYKVEIDVEKLIEAQRIGFKKMNVKGAQWL